MSSDSNEIDDDELLQIALKEQAQRDLNYQNHRASSNKSSKPVVNLVQQPLRKNPNHPSPSPHQMQKNRRAMDVDDDDSDVELLSISSGDEDSYKDRPSVDKNRARAGRGDPADREWDGQEPNCWKHVDESELGRRVREMRETRAVPVIQTVEPKKTAVGRIGLTNLQSFPRGMECVDPLGLG